MTEQNAGKWQVRLPLFLAIAMAGGMFIGQQLPHYDQYIRFSDTAGARGGKGALEEVLRYIDSKYVDTLNGGQIDEDIINQLLEKLDPHSVYISPEELQAVEEDMSGNFEGVGIEFLLVDDTIQVVTPLSGGPSESAGIMAGDKIIRIADTIVAGVKIENKDIFRRLRGPKGSQVQMGILRGNEPKLRDFTITRDVIPIHSVETAFMLDEQTGYFKINRFSARTYQEFMEKLQPMADNQGMKHIVLDLRGNPGGYLNEATDMLSQLFPAEGKLLVYTEGRKDARRDYKTNGRARFDIQQVVVLIDEGSASASEIVAGAIQDHDRGWVIGRRSYGKGLVQEQYPLSNGGALRLTIARYYTPSGRCIQRDYKNDKQYSHEAERRLNGGELSDASKIKIADSTQYYTGMGRTVYGGGGVTPDVFIPLDTSFANDYYIGLRRHLPQFLARWMENRTRESFPKEAKDFVRDFHTDDALTESLMTYAEKQGLPRNTTQWARCRAEIRLQVKARLAKLIYHDEGMHRVFTYDDPAIEKALQVLRNGEPVAKRK